MTGPAEPAGSAADPAQVRIRMPRINLAVLVPLAVATVPLAFTSPWLAVLWLIPIAGLAYVVRAGVDVDRTGITRHTLVGSRRLPWDQLAGLRLHKARVAAQLTDGDVVRLPVVRTRHLPLLAAASGGRLPDPSAQ